MNLRNTKLILFGVICALGIANIVVTLNNGGGITSIGILIGGILFLMGALRIYLLLKHDA